MNSRRLSCLNSRQLKSEGRRRQAQPPPRPKGLASAPNRACTGFRLPRTSEPSTLTASLYCADPCATRGGFGYFAAVGHLRSTAKILHPKEKRSEVPSPHCVFSLLPHLTTAYSLSAHGVEFYQHDNCHRQNLSRMIQAPPHIEAAPGTAVKTSRCQASTLPQLPTMQHHPAGVPPCFATPTGTDNAARPLGIHCPPP